MARDFGRFIDQEVRNEVGRLTIWKRIATFAASLITLIGSLVAWAFQEIAFALEVWLGSIGLVLFVTSLIWLRRAQRALPARREAVRKRGEVRRSAGLASLQMASSEVPKLFKLWESELEKEHSLIDFIRQQATQVDPLSMPALDTADLSSALAEASGLGAELSGGLLDFVEQQHGGDRSFAFRLPSWDLLPPSRPPGGEYPPIRPLSAT